MGLIAITINVSGDVARLDERLAKIEAKMDQLDDELKALTDQVQANSDTLQRTATDVTAILERVKSQGVSQVQHDLLNQATAAMKTQQQTLAQQDDAMEQALGTGTGGGGATA